MGEANRRAAHIAAGGKDWGHVGFRPRTRTRLSLARLSEEDRKKVLEAREQRRNLEKLRLCGVQINVHRPSKHGFAPARRTQARGS